VPVQTVDGENVRVDGIHFSAAGSQWVSRWLLAQLVTSG
jgi:lysophospholipase L1-like esterase